MKYLARQERELTADELAEYEDLCCSEKFARLLFIRGVDTRQKIGEYFDFSLKKLHDPFGLRGMREATDRINAAIANKKRILIIGDYDADGISSVAILYKYFLSRHATTRYFLPDRTDDGYGLNIELIKKLHARFTPDLIITVDCGISCPKEIEFAQSLGIECIVTDHHAIPEITPNCICVNPKFNDQKYPFNELCGAGVALKLVQALGGIEAAERYIDICAIATVADIVPLKGENRVIAYLGLEKLNSNSLPSVTALAKSCNIYGAIRSSDISFKLGPKINASGRMGNAKRGLDIILETDPLEIDKIIQSLTNYNTARQKLCNSIYEDVEAMVLRDELDKNNIIIAGSDKWESGVLGIVSARITEKFGKPSIIFGKTENVYKGSGRSVGDVNIVKTIEQFSDLVLTFGGHSMAAGLSVAAEKFQDFINKITSHLNGEFSNVELKSDKFYDFSLEQDEITPELVREFEKLEPVGCENNAPVFMITVGSVPASPLPTHGNHIKFVGAQNAQFMYFNGAAELEILTHNFPKKIIFEFQKLDSANQAAPIRAVVKGIVPIPTDAKSYALTLAGFLRGSFSPEIDTKFQTILSALQVDREVFIEYYRAIRGAAGLRATSAYDLFGKLDGTEIGLNVYQFIFCTTVFAQLGIFALQSGQVVINNKVITDLFRSPAYNLIRQTTIKQTLVPTTKELA